MKRILIADDDEEIIALLTAALTPAGYAVASTTLGTRLPMMVRTERPDLLILDVMMPGVDGYSLQLQLAQDEETRHIPVIVLTALPASRSLFEKFAQVKHFMNKPFDPDEVVRKVKEILGDRA